MTRTMYNRGARKEYKIMNDMRKQGYDVVIRSAGSHSPVDIIAIDTQRMCMLLIQSKRSMDKKMSFVDNNLKAQLESEYQYLNGLYSVLFTVM